MDQGIVRAGQLETAPEHDPRPALVDGELAGRFRQPVHELLHLAA